MNRTLSERRMAENEAAFRQRNEKVQQEVEQLMQLAVKHNQSDMLHQGTMTLHFYCECSDEDCRERLQMDMDEYARIHERRDWFIILPDHQVQAIEDVVEKCDGYWVVQKHDTPPEQVEKLHDTPADNS